MTLEELLKEAAALAKPCVHLVEDSQFPFAALWGGKSPIVAPATKSHHWVTMDRTLLPKDLAGSGCVAIFTDEDDEGYVRVDSNIRLQPNKTATSLYAQPSTSYPPLEAIFRFGSSAVDSWLKANNWERTWEYNDNFKDQAVTRPYEQFYQSHTPLFLKGPYAQIGGWHMPWPAGDWDDLLSSNLVLWTFRDAEPWLEVWESEGQYRVIARIS